jgi:hypothetical protein
VSSDDSQQSVMNDILNTQWLCVSNPCDSQLTGGKEFHRHNLYFVHNATQVAA